MKLALALLAFNWTFGCDGSAVATMDAQGQGLRLLTADPCVVEGAPRAAYPDVSADGRMIVFVSGTRLATMAADGSGVKVLPIATESRPDIAPRGHRVTYTAVRNGRQWIYTAQIDGSTRRRLRAGSSPVWSPDAKRIAYVSPAGDIVEMRSGGAIVRRIPARAGELAWSPDGRLLHTTRRGALRIAGEGPVLPAVRGASSPAWSPDGRRIAYVRELPAGEEDVRYGVYVARPGGTPRRIFATDEQRIEDTLEPLTLSWGLRPRAARGSGG